MAFRLARHVAHEVDVDEMLREIPPELMDEWIAYHAIEPIDDTLLVETLILAAVGICRGLGMEVEPKHFRIGGIGPKQPKPKPASVACIKANLAAFVALHNASVS